MRRNGIERCMCGIALGWRSAGRMCALGLIIVAISGVVVVTNVVGADLSPDASGPVTVHGVTCGEFSDADRCPGYNSPCPPGSQRGDFCTFCSETSRHKRCNASGWWWDSCVTQPGHRCGFQFRGKCYGRPGKTTCRGDSNETLAIGQCTHALCHDG